MENALHELAVLRMYQELTTEERAAFDLWTETRNHCDLIAACHLGNGVQRLLEFASSEHVNESPLAWSESGVS